MGPLALNRKGWGLLLLGLGLVGATCLIFMVLIWQGSRLPPRPANISGSAAFLERGVVPFKLSTHGDWLDCWEDLKANLDRCKLADEKGDVLFEDVFLPYEGSSPISESDLVIDTPKTRSFHYGVKNSPASIPLIYLQGGQILLPKSDYDHAKRIVDYWVTHKSNRDPDRDSNS